MVLVTELLRLRLVQWMQRYALSALWIATLIVGALTTLATWQVRPGLYAALIARPWTWILVLGIAASITGIFVALRRRQELAAFLSSAGFLVSMLAATAAGLYPNLLTSTLSPLNDLNIENAQAGGIGLRIGFYWWSVAIVLAIGYFVYLFYQFRGKVKLEAGGHY